MNSDKRVVNIPSTQTSKRALNLVLQPSEKEIT